MKFTLPELPYAFDAFEPRIDARTMEIHYSKHHQAYLDKLNAYLTEKDGEDQTIEEIVSGIDANSPAVFRNNAGGYHNHMLFWENLTPDKKEVGGSLQEAIKRDFGSLEACLEQLKAGGTGQFGSGWVWLVSDANGKLSVMSTPNQDSPLMKALYGEGHRVIMGIDVWEHAYYLTYQNKRPDYLDAVMEIIDWDEALRRYEA